MITNHLHLYLIVKLFFLPQIQLFYIRVEIALSYLHVFC